jgi:orotidine-5'-phosphate decarboxylase
MHGTTQHRWHGWRWRAQEREMMQKKLIEHPAERIFVALEMFTLPEALALVEQLHGCVGGFQVGPELAYGAGVPQVVRAIGEAGSRVLLDLKLKDTPNTIGNAVRAVGLHAGPGLRMLTLHCDGGSTMLRAAVSAVRDIYGDSTQEAPALLGVTVLPGVDAMRLAQVGVRDKLESQVLRMAQLAQMAALDGVVAAPQQVAAIRRVCGNGLLVVAPHICPTWASTSDQQQTMPPAEAVRAGADYLIIGRPITAAPASSGGPLAAARRIVNELESAS